jgi:hypothetical protein
MGLPMGLPSLTLPLILLGFEKLNEFLFFSVLRRNVLGKTVITSQL